MLGDFTCRILLQVLGYLYPAYKTYKVVHLPATRSNDTLLRHWCQYWAIMAVFTAVQPVVDTFCFWVPLYYEAKLALAIYLWSNELAGAQHVWARWFQPLVARYEPVMDRRLAESKSLARDWLHSNSMRLLKLAQEKALAWLAQVQATASGDGGAVAGGGARAPRRAPSGKRGSGRGRRDADDSADFASDEEEEQEGEEEGEEAEYAVRRGSAGGSGRGGKRASGSGGRKGGKDVPEEPLLGARFTSFSLSSFYSARSSDLQNQDVKAGLKGFPVLVNDRSPPKDE